MHWVGVVVLASLTWSASVPRAVASDLDRARRDAEKVFSFIKFHTVKRAVPIRPLTSKEPPKRTPQQVRPDPPFTPPSSDHLPVSVPTSIESTPSAEPLESLVETPSVDLSAPARPTDGPPSAISSSVPTSPALPADEGEDVSLRLQEFVAPELTPSLLASLGASSPRVRLRFSVEVDGRVSSAAAREGTPRRLAVVAERALMQWRFEPLPTAQDAEVELVFQRD